MKLVKSCALALFAAALSFAALAENTPPSRGPMMGQGHPMAPGMGHGMGQGMGPAVMAPRPFAGVEFTEEQNKRIQQMMEQERKAHQARVEKMQQFQQELQRLYMQDKWDAAAITQVYEKMHAEQRKTIAAMAEARNKVMELMTKEQREQMRRYQQEQMERFANPSMPPQQ